MRAIVHEALPNQRMMLEQRCRAIPDEEVNRRVRKSATKILEQCRRQYDVPEASQLNEQNLPWVCNAGRLHSGSRHSFAYCTNA
jgi:hypothetical protein